MRKKWQELLTIGALYLGIKALFYGVLIAVGGRTNSDMTEYKVADDLNEYFGYLQKTPITPECDVDRVIPFQMALEKMGYDIGVCGPDGVYGAFTEEAVLAFQDNQGLEQTGIADTQTLECLIDACLSDSEISRSLTEKLIIPYHTSDVAEYVENVGEYATYWNIAPIGLFRPDVDILVYHKAMLSDRCEDVAKKAFNGCANNHLRDYYRHAQSLVELSEYPNISVENARTMLDFRELTTLNNAPGCQMMDMYNHHATVRLYNEAIESDTYTNSEEFLLSNIENGEFISYPFPLVPKNLDIE